MATMATKLSPVPYSTRSPQPQRPVVSAGSRVGNATRVRMTTPRGDLMRQLAQASREASSVIVRDLATGRLLRVERCNSPKRGSGKAAGSGRVVAVRQGKGPGKLVDLDRLAEIQAKADAMKDMRERAGVHQLTDV